MASKKIRKVVLPKSRVKAPKGNPMSPGHRLAAGDLRKGYRRV